MKKIERTRYAIVCNRQTEILCFSEFISSKGKLKRFLPADSLSRDDTRIKTYTTKRAAERDCENIKYIRTQPDLEVVMIKETLEVEKGTI